MKVIRGIERPLAGEHVIGVAPPLAPYVLPTADAPFVRARRNFFTGRALTHVALEDEQRARMAHAAWLAQAVAPGVIHGLEVAREGDALAILPGSGVAPNGEDVSLAYPMRVDPDAIPVHRDGLAARLTGSAADREIAALLSAAELAGLPLGTLRAKKRLDLLPHAMVLTALPVTVAIDRRGELDSPCVNDSCNDLVAEGAYSELAWEDGFQLTWVPWPVDAPIPPWTANGTAVDPRFRNRLAYAIFNSERERLTLDKPRSVRRTLELDLPPAVVLPPGAQVQWPWTVLGVALALVGFDRQFHPDFVDRGAVVRQGGGRRNRSALVPLSGDDVLWQARVAQWLEHLAELPSGMRTAETLAKNVEWLPPAGILPVEVADFVAGRQTVFPASFDVQAQPIPLDMVDALIAEAAPLAPFNLSLRDQVQVLVPVPARFFDPDLLQLDERVHPLFDSEIARLEGERLRLLTRRDGLRRRYDALAKAVGGTHPSYPLDDPNALPDESGALDALAFARVHVSAGAAGAVEGHGFEGAGAMLELSPVDELFVFVRIDAAPEAIALRPRIQGLGAGSPAFFVWGERAGANAVRPLPPAGTWVRLTMRMSGADLVRLEGLEFAAFAAAGRPMRVTWGYAGKTANGRETYWLSDAIPHGATVTGSWVWETQGEPFAASDDFAAGLPIADGNVRRVDEVQQLVDAYRTYRGGVVRELGELWTEKTADGKTVEQPSSERKLADAGLADLIARLDAKIAAANDHIDFGFMRARTDIYRVRQSVLGVEQAGRLLTAPTAAELIQREETPVATEKDFAEYFKRAAETAAKATATRGPGGAAPASAPRDLAGTRDATLLAARPSAGAASFSATNVSFTAGSAATSGATRPPLVLGETAPTKVGGTVDVGTKVGGTAAIGTKAGGERIPTAGSGAAAVLAGEGAKASFLTAAISTEDVAGSSLIGATFNDVTVGERLQGSGSVIVKNAAAAGKSSFVTDSVAMLADVGVALDGIAAYGFKDKETGKALGTARDVLDAVRAGREILDLDAQDPPENAQSEADYFKVGLNAIDNLVRFLRGLEIRIEDYRRLRKDAVAARDRILAAMQRLSAAIDALAARLAEVRHDLSVARALRAEEEARLARLVARRKAILAEQVPFLVFRRPRFARTLVDLPVLEVQPGLVADVVPKCRSEAPDLPPELQQMVDSLKDVPARWFHRILPMIERFDRIDLVQQLVQAAGERVAGATAVRKMALVDDTGSAAARTLKNAFAAQEARVSKANQAAAQAVVMGKTDSWKAAVASAMQAASVADLIRVNPPAKEVTLAAAGELDDIAGVAGCLYEAFCTVPPASRLRWAELVSQFDAAVSLRSLTVLPGFGDESLGVDYIAWRQMQMMVDWLFLRVAPEDDAVAAINDLVRVCLLLSAHAPVKRILSARVLRPLRPAIDARLDLELDPNIARIGMQVLVHAPATQQVVARGVLDDLAAASGVARITEVMDATVTIDASMRVQLQAGAALSSPSGARADSHQAASQAAGGAARSAGGATEAGVVMKLLR
jgi:hypothetical protein